MPDDRPLRLLLVEDEALIAMDLEAIVEDLGYEPVGLAASVTQAISLLDGIPDAPDLAIVDANLGGTSARPIVDRLRAKGIPTIIASGYEAAELQRMGFEGEYLRKPYSSAGIQAAVEEMFPTVAG